MLLVGAGVLTLSAGPAAAGEAARNCAYFYSGGDPNSAWYFEVCAKLEHDPTLHAWRANTSLRACCSGMYVVLDDGNFTADFGAVRIQTGATSGDRRTIETSTSDWWTCRGSHWMSAYAHGRVTWPNGFLSGPGSVLSSPNPYNGSC